MLLLLLFLFSFPFRLKGGSEMLLGWVVRDDDWLPFRLPFWVI
jgi:hypothetical protein